MQASTAAAARWLLLSARLAAAAGSAGEAGATTAVSLGCLALPRLAASSCHAAHCSSQQQGHGISTSAAGRQLLPASGASSAALPPLHQHQQQRHLSLPAAAALVSANPHAATPFGGRPVPRTWPQPSSSSSVLESSIRATPDIARLAAVMAAHGAALTPREALGALQRLNKLNKLHRHKVKQEHAQLGAAALARAAARTQRRQQAAASLQAVQQRLQEGQAQEPAAAGDSEAGQPQQQPADHEEQLQAAAAPLVQRLTEVLPQLSAEQLVHLLSCLAQLEGGASTTQGTTRLLVGVLTELAGSLATLPGSHLSQVAGALAQLDASNLDARSADSLLQDDEDTTGDTAPQPPVSSSSSSSEQHSEQQAAAEAARGLLVKLCAAVQQQQPQQPQQPSSMDGAALATFVNAMARLGHYDWPTMRHVGSLLLPAHVQELTPASISKLLIGCTRLHHFDAQLCTLLAGAAEACMSQASGPEVAQIAWSLAHQRHEHPGVFEAAAQQAVARAHELGPRHVTNLAWAFAVRKAYSPALYDALAARTAELLASSQLVEAEASTSSDGGSTAVSDGDGSGSGCSGSSSRTLVTADGEEVLPQHLSLIAWSFAKQGHKSEALMQLLGDKAAEGTAGEWRPQNISNLAWAFGCLGLQHAPLFAALGGAAKACHLEAFNHQNITDFIWGAVAAGHQDPELFELVARATAGRMPELSPHSLSDLVWAFAAARAPQAPQVLAAAAPVALLCLTRFSSGMLADLLWSYAATGVRDEALLDGVAQMLALPDRLAALEGDIDVQAKIIYGMKVLPLQPPQLVDALGSVVPGLAVLLASE